MFVHNINVVIPLFCPRITVISRVKEGRSIGKSICNNAKEVGSNPTILFFGEGGTCHAGDH